MTLFNSFMVPQPVSDVPMDARTQIIASAIRQRREHLQALAARLRLRQAACAVTWDFPTHEAIVRHVLKIKPDLLMTDSHRHGRLARLLLANTDWELIRTCPCPLWFMRSPSLPKRLRVLVAVDPRHQHAKPARLDDRLLRTASAVVEQLEGYMSVVHAYESPGSVVPGLLMGPVVLTGFPGDTGEFVANTTRLVNHLGAKYGGDATDCIVREGVTRMSSWRRHDSGGPMCS